MPAARQSKIERLHSAFVNELTRQLRPTIDAETGQEIRPTAATLAVIGNFLRASGVRPTDDNPHMLKLTKAAREAALPITLNSDEWTVDRKP